MAAVLLSGCSPEVGFPAVHDMPAPRAEAPLTPDQVKQATDELANERDHLSAATQGNQASPPTSKKAVADARKKPLVTTPSVARSTAANAGQAAGAEGKP